MKGSWIPYNILSVKNMLITAKTQTDFMKFFIVFLIITHSEERSIFVEITRLSWLKRIQELLCKEHVLETNFLKTPTEENKLHYDKQRNFCVSLLRKEKKEYFAKINEEYMTHKMNFWQTVKRFLSYKVKSKEPIILAENDKKSLMTLKLQKLSMIFSQILTKILKPRNNHVKTSYTVD